jgi:predicted DNA-binding protein (UPF0251 family)
MTRRADITGRLPELLGLSHDEAAAYVGVSGTSFDKLVHDGKMPLPREIRVEMKKRNVYNGRFSMC